MHGNQKGFKSPVYRMNRVKAAPTRCVEEQKKLLTMKGLSEANCGRATDRGKEG